MAIQTIQCAGDRTTGGVKITLAADQFDENATRSVVTRVSSGSDTPVQLYEKAVNQASDLNYTVSDMIAKVGTAYTYEARVYNSAGALLGIERATGIASLDGVIITDGNTVWHSAFGTSDDAFKLAYKKNRPIAYIHTLAGKYPHRVSNSAANYYTGSVNALWVPPGDKCGEPTFENADSYRRAFMEFLMTDSNKLLKTEDGHAFIVSIDDQPQENWNPVTVLSTVTFNWTQTGDPDDNISAWVRTEG